MKAILVINEMPKRCDDCPLYQWTDIKVSGLSYPVGCGWCGAGGTNADIWCPLKPMPQKMTPVTLHQCIEDEYLYQKGWNDCLEEITGETE